MQHGATLKLSAALVPQTMIIDISWDDEEPTFGIWASPSGLFGGLIGRQGDWEWDPPNRMLLMRGMFQPPGGDERTHLFAVLEPFKIPVTPGMTGTGCVVLLIIPSTEPITF